jgi:hypothetical protein
MAKIKRCIAGVRAEDCFYKKDLNEISAKFVQMEKNHQANYQSLQMLNTTVESNQKTLTIITAQLRSLTHIQLNGREVTFDQGFRELYEATEGLRENQALRKTFYNTRYGRFIRTKTGKWFLILIAIWFTISTLQTTGIIHINVIDIIKVLAWTLFRIKIGG